MFSGVGLEFDPSHAPAFVISNVIEGCSAHQTKAIRSGDEVMILLVCNSTNEVMILLVYNSTSSILGLMPMPTIVLVVY